MYRGDDAGRDAGSYVRVGDAGVRARSWVNQVRMGGWVWEHRTGTSGIETQRLSPARYSKPISGASCSSNYAMLMTTHHIIDAASTSPGPIPIDSSRSPTTLRLF